MHIKARNVNDAFRSTMDYLRETHIDTADGWQSVEPITTEIIFPCERVLFNMTVDINPFDTLIDGLSDIVRLQESPDSGIYFVRRNKSLNCEYTGDGVSIVGASFFLEFQASIGDELIGRIYNTVNKWTADFDIIERAAVSSAVSDLYADDEAFIQDLITHKETFYTELQRFLAGDKTEWNNSFFPLIAVPMRDSYKAWKDDDRGKAIEILTYMPDYNDWKIAAQAYYERRISE
jgi:hypothetical protein